MMLNRNVFLGLVLCVGLDALSFQSRRQMLQGSSAAVAGGFVLGGAAPPSEAVVYLDPARYGDQELKNAAIAKCRTRVREAVVKEPKFASRFFLLAMLDGLSFEEKTGKGGPDASIAASIQLPGESYGELREALGVLTESQKALRRTNALTLADLIALAGAEAVAAVGGPEISVQLGRTDAEDLNEKIKAVRTNGADAAKQFKCLPAIDLEKGTDAKSVLTAFRKSGFTEREAAALLGTLAILDNAADLAVAVADRKDDGRAASKERGKIGRAVTTEAKTKKPIVDIYGLADGDEDAVVDKMDGDVDDFYIADAFGSRKEAYGRRVEISSEKASKDSDFNKYFDFLIKEDSPSSWTEDALLNDANAKIWLAKYSAERLTYIKDLSKTFYRVTEVGAQYTGGKYAALLDNRAPKKLE